MLPAIRKCLVIGHSGFLGQRFIRHIQAAYPDMQVAGLSQLELDLTSGNAVQTLAPYLDPETCVVMMAAVKRQLGDDLSAFSVNLQMVENLARALQTRPVGRLVYLSSAAVYGEDIENLAISEATAPIPRSYYGIAKLTSEHLLAKIFGDSATDRLVLVRPTTIYGFDEPGTAYGPAGFLKKALAEEPITLWGDGSELRDFVYVDDAVQILAQLCLGQGSGCINIVSGESTTFRDMLATISTLLNRPLNITSRERSKNKVDQRYDNRRLRQWMPQLKFRSVADSLGLMLADRDR
jgi:UDP-glucose 4-epimerase